MARRGDDEESRYPPGFAEALGRTIKVIRTDQGIERRELAERAGISYSYITEIENGQQAALVLRPRAYRDRVGITHVPAHRGGRGADGDPGDRVESRLARGGVGPLYPV